MPTTNEGRIKERTEGDNSSIGYEFVDATHNQEEFFSTHEDTNKEKTPHVLDGGRGSNGSSQNTTQKNMEFLKESWENVSEK